MEKFVEEIKAYKELKEKEQKKEIEKDEIIKEYFLKKSFLYILMNRHGIIPVTTLSKKEYLKEIEKNLKNTLKILIEKIQKIKNKKEIGSINNIIIEICVILEQIDYIL